jgi:hypothetical protein
LIDEYEHGYSPQQRIMALLVLEVFARRSSLLDIQRNDVAIRLLSKKNMSLWCLHVLAMD